MLIHSPEELAIQIKNQRKKLKLTQAEVGDLVGLGQKSISAFENRPNSTELGTIFRILSALKLEMEIAEKQKANVNEKWSDEW